MKIWEKEEFLHIRNLIIFFISYTIVVELIILLLVNFILEKSFTYCTNVHSYFENIYLSKSHCFKEVYDFMLGHTHCSAGPHAARGPRVEQPWFTAWLIFNWPSRAYFNFVQSIQKKLPSAIGTRIAKGSLPHTGPWRENPGRGGKILRALS